MAKLVDGGGRRDFIGSSTFVSHFITEEVRLSVTTTSFLLANLGNDWMRVCSPSSEAALGKWSWNAITAPWEGQKMFLSHGVAEKRTTIGASKR